jgi:hypothetical protein
MIILISIEMFSLMGYYRISSNVLLVGNLIVSYSNKSNKDIRFQKLRIASDNITIVPTS